MNFSHSAETMLTAVFEEKLILRNNNVDSAHLSPFYKLSYC